MKFHICKIEEQAELERKKMMLNKNDNVSLNPEIGKKCSNMYINAIRGKLIILDSLNK